MAAPRKLISPCVQPPLAADHLGERTLAIAVDAGDAEHLAEVQLEANVVAAGLRAVAASAGTDQLQRASAPATRRTGACSAGRRAASGASADIEAVAEHQADDLGLRALRAGSA